MNIYACTFDENAFFFLLGGVASVFVMCGLGIFEEWRKKKRRDR